MTQNPSNPSWGRRILVALGALVVAMTFAASPATAKPDDDITITFVRHGESQSNASGTDGWRPIDWNGTKMG